MAAHWIPTTATRLIDAGGNPIFDDKNYLVGMMTKNTSRTSGHMFGVHVAAIRRMVEQYSREAQAEKRIYCPGMRQRQPRGWRGLLLLRAVRRHHAARPEYAALPDPAGGSLLPERQDSLRRLRIDRRDVPERLPALRIIAAGGAAKIELHVTRKTKRRSPALIFYSARIAQHSALVLEVIMFNRGARQASQRLDQYAQTVEQILLGVGVDPQQARMNIQDGFGWSFRRGSAVIEVYVSQQEMTGYLQVLSPILHLPMTNLLPIYRRLLELNLQLTNAALGVHLDVVYIFSERPLEGLDAVEANNMITLVAGYADELDDKLVDEFGGRLYSRI